MDLPINSMVDLSIAMLVHQRVSCGIWELNGDLMGFKLINNGITLGYAMMDNGDLMGSPIKNGRFYIAKIWDL